MSDNTGNYVSLAQMLLQLGNTDLATKSKIALSSKAQDSGSIYQFTFTGSTAPEVGDFLAIGETHMTIVDVTGSTLKATDGTDFPEGLVSLVKTSLTEDEILAYVLDAMAFIDRHTRQWFNKRTFDSSNPVKIEGNNSQILFLPVPIISIDEIRKNGSTMALDQSFYRAAMSRTIPDDRRNPTIKLIADSDDVLFISAGLWMRGTITEIEGSFGFLEPDGSTPRPIVRATTKLALIYATKSLGEAAEQASTSNGLGPLKREKTDFHEIEYHNPNVGGGKSVSVGTGLSGDDEVDDIIAAYKGPIIVEGSYPDIGLEAPWLPSVTGGS